VSRSVSTTMEGAITAPETSEIFLTLLDIEHGELPSGTIRVVNNNEDVTANTNTYIATAFQFTPPSQNDEDIQPAKITIDNVDRVIVEAIRTITSPATVTARIVLASDPDTTEVGPFEMVLQNVTYNASTVSGELIYLQYLQENAGTISLDNVNFPGLIEWI
jgi:hypothetical protein